MEDNESIRKQLIEEYEFLISQESKEFTKEFMTKFGKELDSMFPGVSFVMSLRYKSPKSIQEKIERIVARTDPTTKNIYDTIGMKIVVTHVSRDVKHANCQDIIEKRDRYNNERQEEESYKENTIMELKEILRSRANSLLEQIEKIDSTYHSNYKFMVEMVSATKGENGINELRRSISELERYIEKNKIQIEMTPEQKEIKSLQEMLCKSKLDLIKQIQQNIEAKRDLYNEQDRKCNDLYSEYMLEQIKNNSKELKNFGILSIPGRCKRHTGSKHYYVASHNSFKTGKKSSLQDWKFEMQVTSDYYNQDASEGKAKHSEKEGKARVLPNIPDSQEEFDLEIKNNVPQTYIYQSSTGKVVQCSDYESFWLYYQEVITGPQYLKNLEKAIKLRENNKEEK